MLQISNRYQLKMSEGLAKDDGQQEPKNGEGTTVTQEVPAVQVLCNCLGFSSRIPSLQDFAPIRRYHLFLKVVIKDSKLISHGNAHCLVDWSPMIIFLQASFQER